MRKLIGIVSEGPTDYMILKSVIDRITGENNRYLSLQPEKDMLGRYGNGWKGVWRWCKETESVKMLMEGIHPSMDAVVIQMDGDVIRKEKEVHCFCESTHCNDKGTVFPLYCSKKGKDCPVVLPCGSHEEGITGIVEYGKVFLREAIGEDVAKIAITIPCDSTDAWVVASYESEIDDIEKFENPWKNVISKGKYYHGIRVRGEKKSTITYALFTGNVAEKWNLVTEKCISARIFEHDIKRMLL